MAILNRNDNRKLKHKVSAIESLSGTYTVVDGDRVAADTKSGTVVLDAKNPYLNSFWVFDAYNTFHINECQIQFDETKTVSLDKRGDFFYFYKAHGVWHWQELVQYSTGEL